VFVTLPASFDAMEATAAPGRHVEKTRADPDL
jgi:hypothetical protein